MRVNVLVRSLHLVVLSFLFSFHVFAQGIQVKGRVVGAEGQPLTNVTVQVKGSNIRALSDNEGMYQINVPSPNSVLVFSYVGFNNQETAVNNRTLVNVSMTPQNNALESVVVVGYGTARKKDVTGSIATFNAKGIEEKPVTRIDQAMVGQMAGVQVRQQTGMPGQGMSIIVRGSGSISAGNEPLYVIDGFPLDVASQNSSGGFTGNPLNNLSPNDIESIQVLKDAAAGAIYGSRAANGVVLITTKKGQVGKAKIGVNANTGFSKVAKKLDVLSPEEWIAQATELANYKWITSVTDGSRTASQTTAERRAILGLAANAYNYNYMVDDRWSMPGHPGLLYVDWQDSAFRTAPFQNYEVSASGGTEAVKYYASVNYLDQKGVLLNSGYKNYAGRANIEVNASKRLKLGLNLAPSYSETNAPAAEGKDAQLMKLFNMTPIVEDTAGMNTGAGKNAVYGWASSSLSPVAFLNNTLNLTKTTRNLYSFFTELQAAKGLTVKNTLNYDEATANKKTYNSDFIGGNITNYLTAPGKSASGSYSGFKKQNFVTENTVNYSTTLAAKHNVNVLGGMSYSWAHIENYTMSTAGGFADNSVITLNNAMASTAGVTITGNTTESNSTMLSYFGRVQYSYDGKYLFSSSLRRDASSRFGARSRWGTFPSLSLGWRISEEPFMKSIDFINDLKLRASYGKSGNNNIGDYPISTMSASNYSFGGSASTTLASGKVVGGIVTDKLHWETSNTYGVGFDLAVLKSRVNVTVDAYQKKNTDLLLKIPVLAASGATSLLMNIGSVKNEGVELSLNTMNIMSHGFQWTTNANISFNQNKVVGLGPDGADIQIASNYSGFSPFLLQIGTPLYSFNLIQTDGILTAADIADAKVAKLSGQTVGDAKYVDQNGDGLINANDRVNAGQPTPKYTWGLTNNFKYKGFDLSVQVYGQMGGKIYSFLGRAIDNPANGKNTTLGVWRNRWTAENQDYNASRGKIGIGYTIPQFTTDWLYSSDFWRVQNITLGYNLKEVIKTGFLSSARVYASALNWFGKDKYDGGVNPEAQNTNVSGDSGFPLPGDYGAMPLNKTITFGINLSL
ncbi:TonB-dependent receptor [Chitinophagaceae bacterium LB-8]|uniref:TonB-dependent receptor n=1 Tax=Paraflavisolibacter caeni TaxID=2982496 RepID=A0A9X2XPD9_9BACT|nr:TonB-dependent receptor [Paraflavisolibacter caeni]MCU7550634.1 TonB-dependent receptor [Paraflavisolibacter caeni]